MMEMEVKIIGQVSVITLTGRFDAQQVANVQQTLLDDVQFHPRVVINMEEVTFIDSAALATLVQGMKRCRQADGDLRICNLKAPVSTIFELTRLDKAFQLFDTLKAAVQSFHG